jgi:hypothetical protein
MIELIKAVGFGLIIGFIGHFDAAYDYVLQLTISQIQPLVSTVMSSLALPGSSNIPLHLVF